MGSCFGSLLALLTDESREHQRTSGAGLALGLAHSLTGLPLAQLSWVRACPLSKPQVLHQSNPTPVAAINLSHEGALLAAAFCVPTSSAAAPASLGVDLQSLARAQAALASPHSGGPAGEALLLQGHSLTAGQSLPLPSCCASSASSALLFAVRWTLMEAVLKARGSGLASQGAAAAVLLSAVEEELEPQALPAHLTQLWGARTATPWTQTSLCDIAASAVSAVAGGAPSPSLEAIPCTHLCTFAGPDWRAHTVSFAWPSEQIHYVLTVAQLSCRAEK
jgi:phosphopantetheinyl transferase